MNKNENKEVQEEVKKNEETNEVKKNEETNEVKEKDEKQGETQKNNEETQKPSKSFSETISCIWNSKPVRFIRKVTKWTLITGGALIGVAAAAKTGTEVALEEHDTKASGGSDSEEIPDEIPGDYEDVEDVPVDSNSEES